MRQWNAVHSRLHQAIFGVDSIANGEIIFSLITQLEALATDDLQDELATAKSLVQHWYDTWYPHL